MADSRRSEAPARPSADDLEKLAPQAETGPLETDLPRPEGVDDATWERFLQWRARKSGAHPLYQSSSHDYGAKPLGDESKLRPPAHPKGGSFTATFKGGGAPSSGGLRTGVSKHRYLKEMDGMV
ncbi:hypothetical protein FNF29_02730 [Cafeteria roenbergensis]|uniref:Uncharacterized protein n=1 Tax=Cafeteria roenbergensis TaxID=33653 RepID=A0A5A8DQE2_CAFRO|nr:hypothetical protein FNF29_02730 [Cafeteria roenbergensis]KAA0161223.1 hypothetical protein FNF28_05102 [Cafeteria roenbergensis]KAA0166847.1 hypothetical protein FNF31_01222 [Cafeteria roenbergensis]|eukprot:KAA0154107.1 hypothetical protein FNF29_02730 [Cafeteria roenbergensis]